MNRAIVLGYLLVLLAVCGCVKTRVVVAPQEQVIVTGSDRDFGLEGIWGEINIFGDRRDAEDVLTISKDERNVYTIQSDSLKALEVTARVVPLEESSRCALVDIEARQDSQVYRRLVFAQRDGDMLRVWWVHSTNLAKFMKDAGYSAVIEADSFSHAVHCKPEELLAVVRANAAELVMEPVKYRTAK